MRATATILRPLLVASLLTGLGAGSLPQCLLAAGGCRSTASHQTAPTCCCRGKCSTHCRMPCCRKPAPSQDRAPAPTKPADDSIAWGLARTATTVADATSPGAGQCVVAQQGELYELSGSLLALSIRFNV